VELRPVDPRTDIYSFGVTCYHMFTGQPPFKGNSPFEIAVQHVQKEPAPMQDIRPDLPPDLCILIHRMMAKSPENRPQTSREIVREVSRLRDMLVGSTSAVHSADVAEAHVAPALPHRASGSFLLAGVTMLLALAAGLAGSYFYWGQQSKPWVQEDERDAGPNKTDEREKELTRLKDEHTPPKKIGDVKYALDLGVFYLQEGQFDKAEALFQAMNGEKELGDTGKLGSAMVLAFRGDTRQSYDRFAELLPAAKDKQEKVPEDMPNAWRNHPQWRKMLATALLENKAHAPEKFPAQLERWLRAPGPIRKVSSAPKG